MHTKSLRGLVLTSIILSTSVSCSDAVAPTVDSVAGAYSATLFLAEGTDVLAAGGSLTLALTPSGEVDGQLVIPASVGGPLDADMAGTYQLMGNNISFDQAADTFVRDATWTWSDGELSGTFGSPSDGVSVRLER